VTLIPDSFGWPGLTTPPAVKTYLSQGAELQIGRFDESFTVYDQPLVIIFQNEGRLSAQQLLEQFRLARTEVDDGAE
jgi:hypothetical protein